MNTNSMAALEAAADKGDDQARIELANRLLESGSPRSAEAERAVGLLRGMADGPYGPAAEWLLGAHYLQTMSVTGTVDEAQAWIRRAAESGVPPAIDRLANLYLRGLGVSRSTGRAIELLQRLADAGYQRASWEVGYLWSQEGDENRAASAFARGCALGYPPAYYSLGLRFALGNGVARDPGLARALLMRARDIDFPDALGAADELVPEGADTADWRDWYQALKDKHEACRQLRERIVPSGFTIDETKNEQVRSLESAFAELPHAALRIGEDSRLAIEAPGAASASLNTPAERRWLSRSPRVAVIDDFVSREECAHLMFLASQSMGRPGDYVLQTDNGQLEKTYFDGSGCSFGALLSDSVVRTIEQRMAQAVATEPDVIEPLSVIRYQPGEEYRSHVDYFTHEQIDRNRTELNDLSGQRLVTFLVCLHAPESGGETAYEKADVEVHYHSRMAALHYNVTTDGQPDVMSVHRGRAVSSGEKWLLRTTLREYTRYPRRDEDNAG